MNMHRYTYAYIYIHISSTTLTYMYICNYRHGLPSLRFRLFNNTPDEKAKGELKHGRTFWFLFFAGRLFEQWLCASHD